MAKITTNTTNGDIKITPNGTGKTVVGTGAADATLQSSGNHSLVLQTGNATTGSITITDGANGNIAITPNGTGEVDISKVDIDGGTIDGTTIGGTTPAAGTFTTFTSNGIDDNAASTALTIDGSGKVGIGTNSPFSKLHVLGNGSVPIRWGNTSSLGSLTFGATDPIIQSATGTMLFYGPSSEYMRIDSSGHVIVPNGVTLGTAVGTYNAANTLDDYEEGTWTPSFVGSTSESGQSYSKQDGVYVKIGRMVHAKFTLQLSAEGTFNGTYLLISGLPFAIASSVSAVHANNCYFVNLGVNVYSVGLQLSEGNTSMYLWAIKSAVASREYLANTDLSNSTTLSASIVYQTS